MIPPSYESERLQLPPASKVSVAKLQSIFSGKTTSYKYLLFRAILSLVDEQKTEQISFADLQTRMLASAWVPKMVYRLNFGQLDQLERALHCIKEVFVGNNCYPESNPRQIQELFEDYQHYYSSNTHVKDLTNYCPFRILQPWFSNELRGLDDALKNKLTADLSVELFDKAVPLFKIDYKQRLLTLHPLWVDYLSSNYTVIEGWHSMHWLKYLQHRNMMVPALANKLWAMTVSRSPLTWQRKYWRPVVKQGFSCIYTGKPVQPDKFALDHFLPWKWVTHDEIWNLVPISPDINSRKSDQLPRQGHVVDLARAHAKIIKFHVEHNTLKRKIEDEYCRMGLFIDSLTDVKESTVIVNQYKDTLNSELDRARKQGFEVWQQPSLLP